MSLGVKGDAVFIHPIDALELKPSLHQLTYLVLHSPPRETPVSACRCKM
jgi:hypothetical protein